MHNSKSLRLKILKKTRPLRVGFLPVNDCAPLAVACELGLFEKYDLFRRATQTGLARNQISAAENNGWVARALPAGKAEGR